MATSTIEEGPKASKSAQGALPSSTGAIRRGIYIMNDKTLKVRRYNIEWIMVSRLDLMVNLQLYRLTFEEPKHVPAGTRSESHDCKTRTLTTTLLS